MAHHHRPVPGADFEAGYLKGRLVTLQRCACGARRYITRDGWRIDRGAWMEVGRAD